MPRAKTLAFHFVLSLAVVALLAPSVRGQFSTYPGQTYFRALDELHSGDFTRAARVMQTELRTAVKTVDSRWLDSICFATGLGEALYQQGRYGDALVQFDAALDLFLNQATWMRRIQFQQSPREDTSLGRRMPPWAVVGSAVYADVPRSFLYQQGQVDNTAAQQQGGVVQPAQFWKLDCEELSRAIAWSLYRRGDLLGPLGAYDSRAQAVATRLAGGGLGPSGHWTAVWPELWWGLAKGATGDAVGAMPHLRSAALLGGRMQHRLTGLALLAQGRLTAAAGDGPAAGKLLQQAISAAVAYNDFDVLAEAVRALHELSLADPTAPKPPLAQVVAWTEQSGVLRVSIDARLALIENAILGGDFNGAKAGIGALFRRTRDPAGGWMGREAERLAAIIATAGPYDAALTQARRAVAAQQKVSLRRLRLMVANAWHDDGRLSKRQARQAYAGVLGDPGPIAWQTQPIDAVAAALTPERDGFDRWFGATLDNRDPLLSLRVIDQQRRREVFAGEPMAGRMVAVRWLLEASDEALPVAALAVRSQVEAAAPEYRQHRSAGAAATSALRAAIADSPDAASPAARRAVSDLQDSIAARENLVLRVALSRTPTPLVFPPAVDPVAAKQQLTEGEAVLVFHESAGETYGVVLTAAGEHLWRLGPSDEVAADIERLLREIVGSSPKQSWTAAGLSSDGWRESADVLSKRLFAESRLDATTLRRLWVVPDGPLWRAPLAVLTLPGSPEGTTLADVAISYAPTPGWATRPRHEKPQAVDARPTWAISADPKAAATFSGIDAITEVAKAASLPKGLDPTVMNIKATAGQLVIDVGAHSAAADPLGLPLTSADRGQREVGAWIQLPLSDPTAVALREMGGGEAGGAKVRRTKADVNAGAPELHVVASLLAGGAEPLLVERWSTGGARSRDYVAEWLSGLARLPATEAWDRARRLLLSRKIDVAHEPRLAASSPTDVSPEHPLWWAGCFVVE